ncbi:MAG TPA: APC family permease [Anaerolineales bacterium]|nr:APC family permease [Anaerolineales bacterium]
MIVKAGYYSYMIDPTDNQDTSLIHRKTEIQPTRNIGYFFIGRPLQTADAPHQTIGKAVGLAVFASDALSSTAYATQEILVILAAAGTIAFGYVFPISVVIVGLLAIVVISYEQIIHAYPNGGGAYIVASDNLGKFPALVAAAALLTDYILTVSVSISSGVAQIVSAYPQLFNYRVPIAVVFVMFIMVVNLRGVREAGAAFAFPSYFFIVIMLLTIGTGLMRMLNGTLGVVVNPPEIEHFGEAVAIVTPFLLLHAFSSGTTALTGVEAISNGTTAFKEPRGRNAGITLIWMAFILGILFMGISFLTREIHAVPSEAETVISQLARTVFNGQGIFYMLVIIATTVILILAANTAFAGFPRLSAMLAEDGFMPRQLAYRGSRLVYSYGIVFLAGMASVLIIVFQASVTRLIPLYAIGVFLSFTLAQAGMARRWWRAGKLPPPDPNAENKDSARHELRYEKGWFIKMLSNGFGTLCTAMVMLVFAVTKFRDGAWVVLILTPLLISIFLWIHRHYTNVASSLSLNQYGEPPPYNVRHRVLVPISNVHQGTLAALRYARMLSDDITAVHISMEPGDTEKVRKTWETWGRGTRLVIVDSPYRLFLEPLLDYVNEILSSRQANETITIVVPHTVPDQRIYKALHMQTAEILRRELLSTPGVVITEVPYQIP